MEIFLSYWMTAITLDNVIIICTLYKIYTHNMYFLKCLEVTYMVALAVYIGYNRAQQEFPLYPYANKVILCLGLVFYHYRVMYSYLPISPTLGPLLFRIKKLISVDFVNYICLVIFAMIGNGIVVQSLIYPDFPFSAELIRRTFQRAWISFFVSKPYDSYSKEQRCQFWKNENYTTDNCRMGDYISYDCPKFHMWPYLINIQAMILIKLIFMALLFALTVNAHMRYEQESEYHWKFFRYILVESFSQLSPIPPPLNILFYLLIFLLLIFHCLLKCCSDCMGYVKGSKKKPEPSDVRYSYGHYSFWEQVYHQYTAEQRNIQKASEYSKEKLNMITEFQEGIKYQEQTMYTAKSQIAELEADVCFTRLSIQTRKFVVEEDVPAFSIHVLSRKSPYVGTKIDRYPVPDKYVPWEVKWLNYTPMTYSAPPLSYPDGLRIYADDITIGQPQESAYDMDEEETLPKSEIRWNMNYMDSQHIYRRRRSWITDTSGKLVIYLLQDDKPQNPRGRTGLNGKGSLLQWGPNHYVFVIITRYKDLSPKNPVEFLTKKVKQHVLSLPGGFAQTENRYKIIQDCFSENWETESEMRQFFMSCVSSDADETEKGKVKCELVRRDYMDDPYNTDNAWKEVELWHVHYDTTTTIDEYFNADLNWSLVDGKVFRFLPHGQSNLLKEVLETMNVKK